MSNCLFISNKNLNILNSGEELKETLENEKTYLLKYLADRLSMLRQDSTKIRELIHTNSRNDYLNVKSIDIAEEFLKLFEKFFSKAENTYLTPFIQTLQNSDYLRDCFQLAICLGKHDVDSCLDQIEANKNDKEFSFDQQHERNELYTQMLKRVFFLIVDLKKASSKEIKRFLNTLLKDRNMRIVSSSYKVSYLL